MVVNCKNKKTTSCDGIDPKIVRTLKPAYTHLVRLLDELFNNLFENTTNALGFPELNKIVNVYATDGPDMQL